MRNRVEALQRFNKPWEQGVFQGRSRRNFRRLVNERPSPKAALGVPVLVGSPGLDIMPGCIQPGQPVFNEALIETELRLQTEESED